MRITQLTLDGGAEVVDAAQDMNLDDKVQLLMERYPATRSDDVLLTLLFWIEFDGWRELLGGEVCQAIVNSNGRLAKPATLSRARRRCQRLRKERGTFRPTVEVQEQRRRLDGAGPAKQRKW